MGMLGNLEISGNTIPTSGPGSGTVTNTGTLSLNAVVIGDGGNDIRVLGDTGSDYTVLHGNSTGGPPNFSPVDLATDITGDLPYANLTPATAASKLLGRGDSGAGDWQEITLGANLTMTGTTLAAAGGSGSPGGANTQVQFNNGGAFGGDADLTFVTDTLTATKIVAPTSVSTPSLISTTALTVTPASGSNLNVVLATTGDFVVNTNQLYVDTSADSVGIGIAVPLTKLHIKKDGNYQLRVENASAGGGFWSIGQSDNSFGSSGQKLLFVPDSTSSTSAKVVFTQTGGVIAGNWTQASTNRRVEAVGIPAAGDSYIAALLSPSDDSQALMGVDGSGVYLAATFQISGAFKPLILTSGAVQRIIMNATGSVVFNESGVDYDVRMEGDTEQNLFFLDASTDRIGIGTASPQARFEVLTSGTTNAVFRNSSNTSFADVRLYNDQNSSAHALYLSYTGSAYASAYWVNGPTGEQAAIGTPGNFPIVFGVNNNWQATLNTTGLSLGATASSNGYLGLGTPATSAWRIEAGAGGAGATAERVKINGGATGLVGLSLYRNSVGAVEFTIAASASQVINNSAAGDMCFRNSQGILISADAGTTDHIHLTTGGNVGFSVAVPTALTHFKAGSTTAGTAPIKLSSGTVMTTAEAGAIEFTTDTFFATITTGAARKGVILDDGSRLTSGKVPIATTNGRLVDSTTVPLVVGSTFEKAETGSDANVLTYTAGGTDEFLVAGVAVDVSAFTGTSIVVTVTWKDSNNSTQSSSTTLTGVGDGFINVPYNAKTATNTVVSTTFVGVSTAYNISAVVVRFK